MEDFKSFLNEEAEYQDLMEKLITFAGKAYPRFGNIVIMAGGAGSGKGFVKDKLLGIEGYSFDVDELKKLVSNSRGIAQRIKDDLGIDVKDLASNMKDPENVARLHYIVADHLSMDDKRQAALFTSILTADDRRKPNLIFDVTLKNMSKLQKITNNVKQIGYDPRNVHIVWVVNDVEVALAQNKARSRTVPTEILINTHRGVSQTMRDILDMGDRLNSYMNGDIVFAFNKAGVDNEFLARAKGDERRDGSSLASQGMYSGGGKYSGGYFKEAEYVYVKRAGKRVRSLESIGTEILRKIASYVPDNLKWI